MHAEKLMHARRDSALWQPDVKQFMTRATGDDATDNKHIYLYKCLRCRIKHDDVLAPYILCIR
jgi:hypothetical protein